MTIHNLSFHDNFYDEWLEKILLFLVMIMFWCISRLFYQIKNFGTDCNTKMSLFHSQKAWFDHIWALTWQLLHVVPRTAIITWISSRLQWNAINSISMITSTDSTAATQKLIIAHRSLDDPLRNLRSWKMILKDALFIDFTQAFMNFYETWCDKSVFGIFLLTNSAPARSRRAEIRNWFHFATFKHEKK